jgi:hypothetical protein
VPSERRLGPSLRSLMSEHGCVAGRRCQLPAAPVHGLVRRSAAHTTSAVEGRGGERLWPRLQGVCVPHLFSPRFAPHGPVARSVHCTGVTPMSTPTVAAPDPNWQVLGIPTANLEAKAVGALAADVAPGIYVGWASVGTSTQVYKMVMSVGFNPFFDNPVKTVRPLRLRFQRVVLLWWLLTHGQLICQGNQQSQDRHRLEPKSADG